MTPAELQQLLAQAQALHRAGRLADAERAYSATHAGRPPAIPTSSHLLGVLAFQQGNAAAAIDRYRAALAISRTFPQAHNNLAIALKSAGRLDEAATSFAMALEVKPDYAEAAYNFAILHEARGANDEAERTYRLALDAKPDWVEALGNLGNLLRKSGRVARGRAVPAASGRARAKQCRRASAISRCCESTRRGSAEARTLAERAVIARARSPHSG